MAQLTINIPAQFEDRVIEALCAGIPNPDSFASGVTPTPALAKQALLNIIKERVKMYEETKLAKAIPPVDVTSIVT